MQVKLNTSTPENWYDIPESIQKNPEALNSYSTFMQDIAPIYDTLLQCKGIKPKDVRMVLPKGAKKGCLEKEPFFHK